MNIIKLKRKLRKKQLKYQNLHNKEVFITCKFNFYYFVIFKIILKYITV